MLVIKRDGTTVEYDRNKIEIAIEKANNEVPPTERIDKSEVEKNEERILRDFYPHT